MFAIDRRRAACAAVALLGASLGCASPPPRVAGSSSRAPGVAASPPAERAAVAGVWLEDAPEAALSQGQREGKLLLADLWAPWCHTCLSMKAQVLKPERVPELADLVLLSVDTERESNASFLADYPVAVWPTFYLIDPKTREVRGRLLGAATPQQLSQWLKDGAMARPGADRAARDADASAAKRAWPEAEASYRAALAAAPASWPRRPVTLVSLISVLSKQKRDGACLELALAELPSFPPSVSAVDFASSALSCAERTPEHPNAVRLRRLAESTLARDCDAAAPGVAPDDQADACANLRRVRKAMGDHAGAARASEQALAVIARASVGAPPDAQAIYDWERTSSLVFLERQAEAEALLREREAQLPASYNPAHYLARLYRDSQRWDEGLAAIERALGKAYGPRRVGLLGVKADLLKGKGDGAGAVRVLEQQLQDYRALPAGQRQPEAEAAVEQRIANWKAESERPARP